MSQWARNNPEAYERGERYEDHFYERADRAKTERRELRQQILDRMNRAKTVAEVGRIRRELEAFDKEGR